MAAQAAKSDSEQTGGKSQGWVRTDRLQTEIDAGRYNPFGATVNSPAVIDAITSSLKREGESELTAFDASVSVRCSTFPPARSALPRASNTATSRSRISRTSRSSRA